MRCLYFQTTLFHQELIMSRNLQNLPTDFLPSSIRTSYSISAQSSLIVRLQEPLTWIDHPSDFGRSLVKLTFISGIVTGYRGVGFFREIKDYRGTNKKRNTAFVQSMEYYFFYLV
jgi:hypothetical protein